MTQFTTLILPRFPRLCQFLPAGKLGLRNSENGLVAAFGCNSVAEDHTGGRKRVPRDPAEMSPQGEWKANLQLVEPAE